MSKCARNVQLDFFKIVFTILIVIHHFLIVIDHLPYYTIRGYIAVEYFFIVSGYFMFQTSEHNKKMNTWNYLKKRLKVLYPHYIFSLFIMYLGVKQFEACKVYNIIKLIPDIFLLQSVGVFKGGGGNYPAWYISVLITASAILFFLHKKCSVKMYNFAAILCVAIVYCYLFHCGKIEIWNKRYFFYIPWWRGTADLCIGTLIYQINDKLNTCLSKYIKECHIMEIVCTVVLAVCIFAEGTNLLDFIAVFSLVVLVTIMSTPYSLYKRLPPIKLSRYEYAIYLNHAFCIGIAKRVFTLSIFNNMSFEIKLMLVLLTAILYSVATTHVVEWIVRESKIRKICDKEVQ